MKINYELKVLKKGSICRIKVDLVHSGKYGPWNLGSLTEEDILTVIEPSIPSKILKALSVQLIDKTGKNWYIPHELLQIL